MTNADVVRRFEDEFKNRQNLAIVDELMTEGSSITRRCQACHLAGWA